MSHKKLLLLKIRKYSYFDYTTELIKKIQINNPYYYDNSELTTVLKIYKM